jgi:hypothetical protein
MDWKRGISRGTGSEKTASTSGTSVSSDHIWTLEGLDPLAVTETPQKTLQSGSGRAAPRGVG